MMGGRRPRRFGRARNRTLLPLHVRPLSNTLSCWYCDFKTSAFNEPLFRVGRRHARCLQIWFSIGVGFSLTAMLGVCVIVLWESARLLHLYDRNAWLIKLLSGSLFGLFPSVFGLSISVTDVGYMCISTIMSVSAHEFGHALAAASEGIQIEYVAVFLAVLFPGALVAFNYELLQALPSFATLRIYCAGIWHNAACCAVCGLALFFLPLILYPFYIHGESPMDQSCLNPVQTPGLTWVEIMYSSPYSLECWQSRRNSLSGVKSSNIEEMNCGGAFVFIGDAISMAHSIQLTAYTPRWSFYFDAYLPNVLEKIFVCTFHVSLALALLNSLPVYFLDGESILEATLSYLRLLSPRMKGRVLQLCLLVGTIISVFAFLRIFLATILQA
ncbi:membrane-bound transcription factor site-2 protease homolog isoform X3 [Actinidia eriantha]|uniref:membrane-bound transcription factor site-2 protease homolog isoform X3 n=1 Tax=Actinidia eriantha TaxID=165200 RepID=UPI0025863FA8|nr:membrane-bound transcription factor site-2 protease homolog isoform X3 [Actinidia eriantha]